MYRIDKKAENFWTQFNRATREQIICRHDLQTPFPLHLSKWVYRLHHSSLKWQGLKKNPTIITK